MLALLLRRKLAHAANDPCEFVSHCFRDAAGNAIRLATVHRDLQAFLSRHPKALIELPRDHGKSTQICARIVWELGHRPGLRVVLVCATDALAAARGRFIRDAIERNPQIRLVFPRLLPARPWAEDAFSIERPSEVIGPSVISVGLGTGTTGSRADLLVCDDVVDVRAAYSRAERERADAYFRDNLLNLLEPDGRFWGLSTPWHADDLNARLRRNPAFAHFRRAVGANLEPVWPERWPSERLAERLSEIGSAAFARGYRLTPIAETEVLIPAEWVRYWHEETASESVVLSVDPAVSSKATADASALVVLGRIEKQIRVLAAHARRLSAPDLVNQIEAFNAAWQPDVILFETNAAFLGIKDLLVRHATFGPKIQGITQSREKRARIAAFAVSIVNGFVRLRGNGSVDPSQRDLFEEMTMYPFAVHDDLVDAAATGTAYLLRNQSQPRVFSFDD